MNALTGADRKPARHVEVNHLKYMIIEHHVIHLHLTWFSKLCAAPGATYYNAATAANCSPGAILSAGVFNGFLSLPHF